MNTKTPLWLFLIGFSMFLFSCQNKVEYVIPDGAPVVAKLDLKSLLMKADIDDANKDQISSLLKEFDRDLRDQADKMMEDPLAFGVDFTAPVYMFVPELDVDNDPTAYIAMGVKNEDKFGKFLKNLSDDVSIKSKEDYSLVYIDDDIFGVYNKKVALFGDFGDDQSLARKMLQQDKEKSFCKTENADYLKALKGDMTVFVDVSQANWNGALDELIADGMSELVGYAAYNYDWSSLSKKVKNLKFGYALSFNDKGEVALTMKVFSGLDELLFPEEKISTDMLEYVASKDLLGVALVSVDGKPVVNLLRKVLTDMQDYPDELDIAMDLVSDLKGTTIAAINGTNEDNISCMWVAPISEQSLRNGLGDVYDEVVYEAQEDDVEIGAKDGHTYMAYNRKMQTFGESAMDNDKVAEASDYFAYAYIDIPKALKFYDAVYYYANVPAQVKNMFSYAELKAPTKNECSVVVQLDTEANALAFLVDELLDLAD